MEDHNSYCNIKTTMKIHILKKMMIKPCKPTPPHLTTYKISILDELNPPMHVIRILYYSSTSFSNNKQINLERSLAQILPKFYTLAGRYLKEQHVVYCNDQGAIYQEADVDRELLQVIGPGMKPEQLNLLLPLDICSADEPTDPMLAVQVNKFQCGGLAIGVCASHRIFDSCSLGTFLAAWANASRGGSGEFIYSNFDATSFFPAENVGPLHFGVSRNFDYCKIVTKRFVFDKNVISTLRGRVKQDSRAQNDQPPSRVVVVSAFLTRAILNADRTKHGKSRASLIAHDLNIRQRTIPPIPNDSCGTWVSIAQLELTPDESSGVEFQEMVYKLRDAIRQGIQDCSRILSDREIGRLVMIDRYLDAEKRSSSPDLKVVWFTDWSKFGCYGIDFGFGKPIWSSVADIPLQDHVILMNNKDNDGIEAWVHLHESDATYLEQDQDLRMLMS